MATFLTTRNIESALEDLIKRSRFKLLLVTPFIQTHHMVLERLADASARGVSIDIVCREKELKPAQKEELIGLGNTTLWFMEHLHAKCYANENKLILTSMNLYDASRKNREMGMLIEASEKSYLDAMEEIASIIRSSVQYQPQASFGQSSNRKARRSVKVPKKVKVSSPSSKQGFCIRCSVNIAFSTKKPLCAKCYKEWSRYKNEDYPEKHCHSCGSEKVKSLTFAKPQCYKCWKG